MLRPGATGIRMSGTGRPSTSKNSSSRPRRSYSRAGIPAFELDHQLDALRRARRRDAEQVLDVDHADAAQFHVVARQLGTRADEDRFGPPADFDRVVRHEPVSANDQVERAFALADAALADDQDAEPEDVHQHRVHHRALGQRVFEDGRQLGDRGRRGHRTSAAPAGPSASATSATSGGGVKPPVISTQGKSSVSARRERAEPGRRVEALEIADLALAENQHAARPQILVETGEGQPGLLTCGGW